MYDDSPEDFRRIAYRYYRARAGGRLATKEHAEDFAQWAVLKFIEGRKASVPQLYVDFLRLELGDGRTKGKRPKACSDTVLEKIPAKAKDTDFSGGQLESFDRALVFLIYKWGFSEVEVAECFGVGKSRVSQRLKRVKKELKGKLR